MLSEVESLLYSQQIMSNLVTVVSTQLHTTYLLFSCKCKGQNRANFS